MSVLVGHASIDENGKAAGGKAGDQTGKEVCTRNWWAGSWNVLLRPAPEYANGIARACEEGCANNNIGYSQPNRNTLHTKAKANGYDLAHVEASETDCSAFVTVCCIAGGVGALEYNGNAPTTRTMKSAFKATNKFAVLTDKKFLTDDKWLKRGDILLREGHHTIIVLSNGEKAKEESTPDLVGKDVRAVAAVSLSARVIPNGTRLFVLSAGDKVNVVEEKNGWSRIEAWVSTQYLVK